MGVNEGVERKTVSWSLFERDQEGTVNLFKPSGDSRNPPEKVINPNKHPDILNEKNSEHCPSYLRQVSTENKVNYPDIVADKVINNSRVT